PSHFGSYCQVSPAGSCSTDFASIGKYGCLRGRVIVVAQDVDLRVNVSEARALARAAFQTLDAPSRAALPYGRASDTTPQARCLRSARRMRALLLQIRLQIKTLPF